MQLRVIINEIKLRSFESSERINEKGNGPYLGFGYISLFGDPVDLQHGAKRNNCNFATFNWIVDTMTIMIQMGPNILNVG